VVVQWGTLTVKRGKGGQPILPRRGGFGGFNFRPFGDSWDAVMDTLVQVGHDPNPFTQIITLTPTLMQAMVDFAENSSGLFTSGWEANNPGVFGNFGFYSADYSLAIRISRSTFRDLKKG
jgi:hypothetical protein